MDLMGPVQTVSLGGKKYVFVVVDDFSCFTCVRFLKEKSDNANVCIILCLSLQREQEKNIVRIRSDHGKEFKNEELNDFYKAEGIHCEYSASFTPQQNGVVERKNRTLQEMARVMIHVKYLPLQFWAEVMNTACHIHNRIITHSGTYVTLYELWKGRKPNVKVFNDRTRVVVETIDVVMNDNEQKYKRLDDDDDFPSNPAIVPELAITDSPTVDTSVNNFDDSSKSTQKEVMADVSEIIPSSHVQKNHPLSFIIGDPSVGITTKKKDKIDYAKMIVNICYTSFIEPT
ncbi:gag-pol polyprotein [Cucumis melo var. makuwa]|uniref:Gag-pol polyprotein n=1 Tax=Cucumis melo var. makuwa TaxID=1194695 RepID=A0A5A7T175_CUCMM|nr:gag-pol polyprotein [Cucumis melo var. makuwa]